MNCINLARGVARKYATRCVTQIITPEMNADYNLGASPAEEHA
jgi:hypothetical protein